MHAENKMRRAYLSVVICALGALWGSGASAESAASGPAKLAKTMVPPLRVPGVSNVAQSGQALPTPVIRPKSDVGKLNGPLTPQQKALIDRINLYLTSVQTLFGDFVQVGPDGTRSEGKFYLQKPGRMRFEYDDPSP